uniref:autotransporter-associated beta strand repeat-containing protein n=1 Tax=Luteolibacter marinus TaxID=2776705 RepID=UPI00186753E1
DFTDGAADNGNFTGIFEFSGGGDGDYFIRKQGTTELGVAAVGYVGGAGTFQADTWYRLVYTVDSGGIGRSTYLNGSLIGNNNSNNTLDYTRGSLNTTFGVFQDDTLGEQSRVIVSTIALYDDRLTPEEVTFLSTPGNSLVLPEPAELTWTGATSGEWSQNPLTSPKNWVRSSDGTTEDDFEDLDVVLFDDSSSVTTVDISNGDVQPAGVTFDTTTNNYTLTGSNGITGATGILIDGEANLRIENANSHSGDTDHVTFGDLVLAHPQALQNSRLITYEGNNYVFDGITSVKLGGLEGNGDIVLENSSSAPLTMTVGNNNTAANHTAGISGSGSFVKASGGLQTLSGINSYSGGTTVSGGVLCAGDISAFGSGSVTADSTVEFAIADGLESTVSNDFTLGGGTGIVRMFGSFASGHGAPTPGTVTRLTGKISGGSVDRTFRFGDTNIAFEHDNVIILDNPANDFVGLMQQWRAVLAFTSDGALGDPENDILIDCANYNGGLRFAADSTLGSTRTITLASSEVISSGTFTGAIDGPVTGAGNLRKLGEGTLILNHAANDYAGVTQVNEGTLQIDGTLAAGGTVTVDEFGTLGGNGTIERAVSVIGTLSPGASVGTLNVGSTTLGGTFMVEIDGLNGDQLVVNGDLDLSGAVLDVVVLGGGFTEASYVIGTYSGALTGSFASVTPGYSVTAAGGQIVLQEGSASGFDTWASAKGVSGFEDDSDGDGLANGIEFVIGGEPAAGAGSDSSGLLPTVSYDAGTDELVFVFRRMPEAAYLNPGAEYNTSLDGTWTTAPAGSVIGTDGDAELVEVRLASSLAIDGKLFCRLAVSQ